MRLIDADAVFEKFSKEYKETTKLISSGECHLDNLAEGFTECHEIIKSMPTIDAVPVVRCKDCKFFVKAGGKYDAIFNLHEIGSYCGRFISVFTIGQRDGCLSVDRTQYWCNENDYCSNAEKKDGD